MPAPKPGMRPDECVPALCNDATHFALSVCQTCRPASEVIRCCRSWQQPSARKVADSNCVLASAATQYDVYLGDSTVQQVRQLVWPGLRRWLSFYRCLHCNHHQQQREMMPLHMQLRLTVHTACLLPPGPTSTHAVQLAGPAGSMAAMTCSAWISRGALLAFTCSKGCLSCPWLPPPGCRCPTPAST
jgi:hypothetical protein